MCPKYKSTLKIDFDQKYSIMLIHAWQLPNGQMMMIHILPVYRGIAPLTEIDDA